MSSELDDFLEAAHAQAADVVGASRVVANGRTAHCVVSVPEKSAALMDSGLLDKNVRTLTLARRDFTRLAITDRLRITIDGTAYKVMTIEDDGRTPIINLYVELSR